MYRDPLFKILFILAACIAGLHTYALSAALYYTLPWFDLVMHFLGGSFVSIFTLWFFFRFPYYRFSILVSQDVIIATLAVIVIGGGWELFEYVIGYGREAGYL